MIKLRDYQESISKKACLILKEKKIVYLCMEVRTGKTITSLETAKFYGAKKVLFLTKKKAISNIQEDYDNFGYAQNFELVVCNDESMHKINVVFDLIIHDEHHRFGAFPKAGLAIKTFKEKFSSSPMIFLSGTPFPESYSQVYHQFWVSDYSPFKQYTNFYRWAKDYIYVKQKNLGYAVVNDYSDAKYNMIAEAIKPYLITYTQKQLGFISKINETVLYCDMKPTTYWLCNRLKRDRVIETERDNVVADTAVKLMQKLHQMYSGTIRTELENRVIIDYTKADFIKEKFKDQKIAIFYKFKAEWNMLKNVFGESITRDVSEFDTTNKNIALQIVSGREGISLKNAESLVFLNIDFSAVSYWQARDRMTTKERAESNIYWIFSRGGIEESIYKTVLQKKDYNLKVFQSENGI